MKSLLNLSFACILLFTGFSALAQKDYSSWQKFTKGELILETTALAPGSLGTAGLRITLVDHWHTYWVNPGDSGSALRLSFRPDPGLSVKSVQMPLPTRLKSGPLVSFAYEREVLFPIELEVDSDVLPGRDLKLKMDAEWLVCEQVCLPAIASFELKIPVRSLAEVKPGGFFSTFQKTRALLPQAGVLKAERVHLKEEGKSRLLLQGWDASAREFVDFFPYKNAGFSNSPVIRSSVTAKELALDLEKTDLAVTQSDRIGVLVSRSKTSGALEAWSLGESGWRFEITKAESETWKHLGAMLIWAFIGGLLLNLMPCVFPVLSMKLLGVLKLSAAHHNEVRAQNFAYVLGVLVSFLLIALLLSAFRSAGSLVGWGFQLQSPVFLSLLSWLFFALTLNLLGFFEIDFLNAGFGHRLTRLGGLTGSFFTGVLAVVVASPCTAPFMGVALGFGLAQPTWVLLAVFLSLGLGLAFPYLLFAIFPQFVNWLPRPGPWMSWVKKIMALPLLLTTVWLLWILAQLLGVTAVMIVIAGCVTMAAIFLVSDWRKSLAQFLTALIMLIGIAFIYQSEALVKTSADSGAARQMGPWRQFDSNVLQELDGRNVFVNMTADWCLTCKVNERLVFSSPEVLEFLASKEVVLVKGDWTQRNDDITRFLDRYRRVGVPFYVLYSERYPDGLILPEVLTVSSFKDWVSKAIP